MGGIAKEDITDVDIVDSRELLSDGTDAYQSSVSVTSVTASTKTVVVSGGMVYNDDPVESGDLVTIAGNAAAGDYTVDAITDDTTFTVVESTTDATGGTATFNHPPGATKVGVDDTNLYYAAGNVQEALEREAEYYAVGAYNSIFTMPAPSGTSDYVPFNTTEFESQPGMHDPTVSDSGTATGTQTSTTLQDTGKSWTTNQFVGYTVQITGGTGSGQWRQITSNTSNTLTVGTWGTTPDGTSTYSITQYSTRLVAPIDGVYEVIAHMSIQYQAGVAGIFFYLNGSFASLNYEHQSQSVELNASHSRLFNLSEDDYMEMKVYNGDASVRNLFAGIYRLTFQMHRVGGG